MSLHENYWDLTTGTTFNDTHVVNACLRTKDINGTDVNFHNEQVQYPPVPTSRGWILLDNLETAQFRSDHLPFDNSYQFTIEFEVMPSYSSFVIKVSPYENIVTTGRMEFNFREGGLTVAQPSKSSTNIKLIAKSWNRVFITYRYSYNLDELIITVYHCPVQDSGATIPVIYYYSFTTVYSTKGFLVDELYPLFQKSRAILRYVKFYKYAMSYQTIYDMGVFKYTDTLEYDFIDNYDVNYTDHWTHDSLMIPDTDNACYNYFSSITYKACPDLSVAKSETCPNGYEQESYFCRDN